MNGFDDKFGIKAKGNDSDKGAIEDNVEVLNEQVEFVSQRSRDDELGDADVEVEGEELTLGGFNISPEFSRLKVSKPPVKLPPVGTPLKPPVGSPSKPPVGTPLKPPVGTPPKSPVGTPPKPPVGRLPNPPVVRPLNPPVGTAPKPPATAPASGGTNTLSDLKLLALESFVAPVAVAYTLSKLTGERSLVHPQGSQPNANGSVSYPDGSVALSDGSVKHPDGGVTKPDGLYVYANGNTFKSTTGVYTFADGVSVQAEKDSRGEWIFPEANKSGGSKDADVAPPESSTKQLAASTTLSNGLYTYENGDTFDNSTGVYTFTNGASVQYVRNSSGEWVEPDSA